MKKFSVDKVLLRVSESIDDLGEVVVIPVEFIEEGIEGELPQGFYQGALKAFVLLVDCMHLLVQSALETIQDIVEMGSEVHEFGIKVLLDGHGLDEIQEIALEFGDLIHPDDGIDIHEPLV